MNTQVLHKTEKPMSHYPLLIESRFGELRVEEEHVLCMPEGIYGFEEYKTYALVRFEGQSLTNFHVLQCLDEVGLVFLLTPLLHQGELLIPQADLCEASEHHKLDFKACDFYAITTVCEKDNKLEFYLNLKAPIMVDRQSKQAWQYILQASDYPVRFALQQ